MMSRGHACLYLIDNGNPGELADLPMCPDAEFDTVVLKGLGNVGYGRGHNLAIEWVKSRFHLILNPDVNSTRTACAARCVMRDPPHRTAGAVDRGDDGRQQFLCRRYPTVLDLFVRGCLRSALRKPFAGRLARYENRSVFGESNFI